MVKLADYVPLPQELAAAREYAAQEYEKKRSWKQFAKDVGKTTYKLKDVGLSDIAKGTYEGAKQAFTMPGRALEGKIPEDQMIGEAFNFASLATAFKPKVSTVAKAGARITPDARPTTHRIFEGGNPFRYSPGPTGLEAMDPRYAYRLTGKPQIDDMIESGLVRARLGKMKGGRTGETQWSRGHKTLGYHGENNDGSYVIKIKADKLQQRKLLGGTANRSGGVSIDDVEAVYALSKGKPVNIIDDIRRNNMKPGGR